MNATTFIRKREGKTYHQDNAIEEKVQSLQADIAKLTTELNAISATSKKPKPTLRQSWITQCLQRFQTMLSPYPVMGAIIVLCLAGLAVLLLQGTIFPKALSNHHYAILTNIMLLFGAWQIIKSSGRSLCLPLAAILIGLVATYQLAPHQTVLNFGVHYFQLLILVGIVGLSLSVLAIDQ